MNNTRQRCRAAPHRTANISICLLATLLGLGLARPALAQNSLIVTNTTDTTGVAGQTSLRDAIAYADSGGAGANPVITFASGVTGTITLGSTLTVAPAAGVSSFTIQGPGAGSLTVDGNKSVGVFTVGAASASSEPVAISGLTIADGKLFFGAGIANYDSLTVSNCTLSGNLATNSNTGGEGGAIYNWGTLTIGNSTLTGNSALSAGGAIDSQGSLMVTDCIFSGNTAFYNVIPDDASGGAIANNGPLTISDSTFTGNSAGGAGGALEQGNGAGTLLNDTFAGNIASSQGVNSYTDGDGGAIAAGNTLTISHCNLSGNTAGFEGGAVYGGGTVSISDCTLSGNSAATGGGGAIKTLNTLVLVNDTLSGNTAASTGGFAGAAGIDTQGTAQFLNCIFANDSPGNLSADHGGTFTSLGHNLFTDTPSVVTAGPGDQFGVTNPGLDPNGLANNGGPTQTVALQSGSPAIDAGDDSVLTGADAPGITLTTDQRGFARKAGAHVDIGAYEYGASDATPTVTIATPANGSTGVSLTAINGTASDNVGVARVLVWLRQASSGAYQYWNGTSWGADKSFQATLSGGSWSWPASVALPTSPGQYSVVAIVYDDSNNYAEAVSTFTAGNDTTPPTVTITAPANGATNVSLTAIGGTASDNVGVAQVLVWLRQASSGAYQYWNGTSWGASKSFQATLSGGNWSWPSSVALPTSPGQYSVVAIAYDDSNNYAEAVSTFTAGNDTTPPTVTITTPTNGATNVSLTAIGGTASDNVGVAQVLVWLRQASGGAYQYWNGTSWGADKSFQATLSGGNWSWPSSVALPTGSGQYSVVAIAYDDSNNYAEAVSTFTVGPGGTTERLAPAIVIEPR